MGPREAEAGEEVEVLMILWERNIRLFAKIKIFLNYVEIRANYIPR